MKITALVSEVQLDVQNPIDIDELRFLLDACNGVIPVKFAFEDNEGKPLVSGDNFMSNDLTAINLSSIIRFVRFKGNPNPIKLELSGDALTVESNPRSSEFLISLSTNVIELTYYLREH